MDDLQKQFNELMHQLNNQGLADFEGYSPHEMQYVFYDPFGKESAIQLQKMPEETYRQIPMLQLVKALGTLIQQAGELKLTQKGNLPVVKAVKPLYALGILKEGHIESGITKLKKEEDSRTIHLARILLEIGGMTKKRYNKLSLTKKGEKMLMDDDLLLRNIFTTFCTKFNWGYFDGYPEAIGRTGFGFSLLLLGKYGRKTQTSTFYAEKYLRAYPQVMQGMTPDYSTVEEQAQNAYIVRTFTRFLSDFGFVKTNQKNLFEKDFELTTTTAFRKFIHCTPPQNPK